MAAGDRPDILAAPLLARLTACFCAALVDSIGGSPGCGCCARMGEVALDTCDMAYVRVIRVFPSSTLPDQDFSAVFCPNTYAAELEMGVARCACLPADDGTPPTCACQTQLAAVVLSDMSAMRFALDCCLTDGDTLFVPGPATVTGPQGDCILTIMTVTVALPAD